jgi:hypothetical protein
MSLATDLLNREDIKDYLATHQGASKAITKAAQYMEKNKYSERQAYAALTKLLPALTDKVLHVFFSYKKKDEAAASKIVKVLRKYSAGKLRITYMADFAKDYVGKQWRDEILQAVDRANWFILLLPDPSEDWDWCLYETGLFERELTLADRLICLHHPNTEIPDPIKDYQAVSATIEAVGKFLKKIFVDDNPIPGLSAINKEIESEVPAIAREIVDAISPPTHGPERFRFEPWIKLKVENAAALQSRDDLDSAIVLNTNKEALDLFDRITRADTWGELREGIAEAGGDSRWREELFHVIRKIANGRKFTPIQAIFKASDGRIIRPIVFAIDRYGKGGSIYAYHINFVEEVGAIDATDIPQGVSSLVTLLSMAYRFRWEVLERFTRRELAEEDVDRVANALRRIEQDAASRGMFNRVAILNLFTPDSAERINQMMKEWDRLRDSEGRRGELDIAIQNKDAEAVSTLLKRIMPMNQDFLEIAAERFSQVVANLD